MILRHSVATNMSLKMSGNLPIMVPEDRRVNCRVKPQPQDSLVTKGANYYGASKIVKTKSEQLYTVSLNALKKNNILSS